MQVKLRPFNQADFKDVMTIYAQGIDTGIATFETQIPNWSTFDEKYIHECRIIAEVEDNVVGFAILAPVSKREVYKGVAEVSVYVDEDFHGQGIGENLLKQLISESEGEGFWTLQAGIFPENVASLKLHEKCGFRLVGVKEKIGQLNGKWYDNCFLERRSKKIT